MKRYAWWLLPPVYLIVLFLQSQFLPRGGHPLLPAARWAWRASGNFHSGIPPRELVFSTEGDNVYWIIDSLKKDGSGTLESAPFDAPARLSLMVMGDLTRPGNQVYFRLVEGEKQLPIRVRADVQWRRASLALPSDWIGKPMQLVAIAGPREPYNNFGVGSPRAEESGTLFDLQLKTWTSLPAFVVSLFLFLLPGTPVALVLVRRGLFAPFLCIPLAIVFSSLVGYLAFWIYFWNSGAGLVFGSLALAGSAALLAIELFRSRRGPSPPLHSEVLRQLSLMTLIGLFFVSLLQSVEQWVPFEVAPRIRFLEFTLAVDNEIPFTLADCLYKNEDPRPLFQEWLKTWQTSDRPPLQAGLLLLQMPFFYAMDRHHPKDFGLIGGMAIQCAWIPVLLALWQAGGLDRKRAGIALLLVTLSGFALVNTIYTWPKMLSAALLLVAIVIALFDRQPGAAAYPVLKAVLLGLATALAGLSHGGVAFTVLPFGFLLLLPRYYPGWTRLAVAASVCLALYFPWTQYQKYYDPPGDHLLRMHLAGESSATADDRPFSDHVLAAYRSLTRKDLLANKLENLRVLFVPSWDYYRWPVTQKTAIEWPTDGVGFRRCDFLSLFWAIGLLNAGWFVPIVGRRLRIGVDATLGFVLPAVALASVTIWVALMFGPGGTVVHQGSYATVLLFLAPLAAWLAVLPGRIPYYFLGAQGAIFAVGWLFSSPANQFGEPNVFMIPAAAILFVLLVRTALAEPGRPVAALAARGTRSRDETKLKSKK